jgi:hypothetical protein
MDPKEKLKIRGDLLNVSVAIKANLLEFIKLRNQLNEIRQRCPHDEISEDSHIHSHSPTCLICGNIFEFSHYCVIHPNKIYRPDNDECKNCELGKRKNQEIKGY